MSFDLVIQNGELVDAEGQTRADVGIKNGSIARIDVDLSDHDARTIDAEGHQVLPAALDCHVHFNLLLPLLGTTSRDDYRTGGRAAARGGVTTVIDYGDRVESNSLLEGLEHKLDNEIRGVSPIDYSLHGCVYNWDDRVKGEMKEAVEDGFPSHKMFMIYADEGWRSDDVDLYEALQQSAELGSTICVHCENDALLSHLTDRVIEEHGTEIGVMGLVRSRPPMVEYTGIQRLVEIAEVTGGRAYVVHMSTGKGAEIVARARERGVNVFAETCPQFLVHNEDVFHRENGHYFSSSPQIKTEWDRRRLWTGLNRDEIEVIATDNCTWNREQKDSWGGDFRQLPRGLPGVETMFPIAYTEGYRNGDWSLQKVVRHTSTNPAKIHGCHPEKGSLTVGSDADLIVVDPDRVETVRAEDLAFNSDWSPYEGMDLYGFPRHTLCRGEFLIEDYELQPNIAGHGRRIERSPGGTVDG